MRAVFSKIGLTICVLSTSLVAGHGCSTTDPKVTVEAAKATAAETSSTSSGEPFGGGATIDIKPNSPADTVRVFYGHLREKRFRDALFLTNLRPAIEGLTDSELKDFEVDFESIAKYVPAQIKINGEIVSGDNASVTAKLPNKDLDKEEVQQINLRKNGDVWVIMTIDESAEKKVKQEGKNYFRELRIETHQDEAREMLDRIAKAQMVFSATNQGLYGDMEALIKASFLPDDIRSSESTGYDYSVSISADRKTYSASAVPAVYGKSGRLSFMVDLDKDSQAHLTSRDEGARKAK